MQNHFEVCENHQCVSYMGLSGTLGPIMITMKTTHGLSGTSLVGLLRMGAQKIRGSILVNLIPNT